MITTKPSQIGRPKMKPGEDCFKYWHCPNLDQPGQEFILRRLTVMQYRVVKSIADHPNDTRIECAIGLNISVARFTAALGCVIKEWALVIDPELKTGKQKVALILEIFEWYRGKFSDVGLTFAETGER